MMSGTKSNSDPPLEEIKHLIRMVMYALWLNSLWNTIRVRPSCLVWQCTLYLSYMFSISTHIIEGIPIRSIAHTLKVQFPKLSSLHKSH